MKGACRSRCICGEEGCINSVEGVLSEVGVNVSGGGRGAKRSGEVDLEGCRGMDAKG